MASLDLNAMFNDAASNIESEDSSKVKVELGKVEKKPEVTSFQEEKPVIQQVEQKPIKKKEEDFGSSSSFSTQPKAQIQPKPVLSSGVTLSLVNRILLLNTQLQSVGETVRMQIIHYLSYDMDTNEVGGNAEAIFNTFNISHGEVDALLSIVNLHSYLRHERVFSLMSFGNVTLNEIKRVLAKFVDISEEIPSQCSDTNKLDFCKYIELAIDSIDKKGIELIKDVGNFLEITLKE